MTFTFMFMFCEYMPRVIANFSLVYTQIYTKYIYRLTRRNVS